MELYFDEEIGCSWFNIPPSVHKIMVHGADIIDAIDLPLGLLSEEPSEANNRRLRLAKWNHSRLNSRINTFTDMYNRCMDGSDPIVLSYIVEEKLSKRPKRNLPPEVADLIKEDVFFDDIETEDIEMSISETNSVDESESESESESEPESEFEFESEFEAEIPTESELTEHDTL
jgi:hypothetical protein